MRGVIWGMSDHMLRSLFTLIVPEDWQMDWQTMDDRGLTGA
jgi:hypothetical protein